MKESIGSNFSFKCSTNLDDCNLNDDLLSEGCTVNKLQEICMLKANMDNICVSKRVCIPRIVCKASANNLPISKLLRCDQVKVKKNSTTTACSYKMTRKEEIKELLHRCASVRKRDSSINLEKEIKRIYLFQAKKAKSHFVQNSNEDFVTMKQIPPLE